MKPGLIARAAAAILVALLILLGAAAGWLGSDSGRAWLTARLINATDGAIRIEALSGHPLHRLAAASIEFRDDNLDVHIERFEITWRFWALLAGQLHIQSISASRVRVQTLRTEQTSSPSLPLGLISRLRLDAAHINAIDLINPDGQPGPRLRNARFSQWAFMPEFSGIAEFLADEQKVELRLAGAPANWTIAASMIPAQAAYPATEAVLRGSRLDAGDVAMTISTEEGKLDIDGRWTYADDTIQAQGGLDASFSTIDMKADWAGSSDKRFEHLHFSLDAAVDGGTMFGRLLHITAKAEQDDAGLHGSLREDGGLLASWRLDENKRFHIETRLQQWAVPLARAEGRLTGEINTSIDPASLDWTVEANINEGEMAGMIARLAIDGSGQGGAWRLGKGEVDMLGVHIEAQGSGDMEHMSLDGRITSQDVGDSLHIAGIEEAQGDVSANFALGGLMRDPRLQWRAASTRMTLSGAILSDLDASGWLRPLSQQGEIAVQTARISHGTNGQWTSAHLRARLDDEGIFLNSSAEGSLAWRLQLTGQPQANGGWRGNLGPFSLVFDDREVLAVPRAGWRWQDEQLSLPGADLRLAGLPATLKLATGLHQLDVHLDMDTFDTQSLREWLSPWLRQLEGDMRLSLALSGGWRSPEIAIEGEADKLRFSPLAAPAELPPLAISDMHLSAGYANQNIHWRMQATGNDHAELTSRGDIPWLISLKPWSFTSTEGGTGQAQALLRLSSLSAIRSLAPQLDPLAGSAVIDVAVHDPFGESRLTAKADIALDALGLPEAGLDLHGRLSGQWRERQGALDIDIQAGDGNLRMSGPLSWPVSRLPALSLRRFPLVRLPDQEAFVDGELNAHIRDQTLWIEGNLSAAPLRITIPDTLPEATDDLIWRQDGQVESNGTQLARTRLDIAIDIGDGAEIRGRGMQIALAGSLRLGGSLSRPELSGELRLPSGGLNFRDIHLDVAPESRMIFTGDAKRPLIELAAVREIDNIVVGVRLQGPADQLESRLFSEPAMPDAEIMSYLATGRPLTSLGKDYAADAMALAGFLLGPGTASKNMKDKLQRALGLDSLEVNAGLESSTIAASKKLGKRTTVSLEETVAAAATTAVTVEYNLTRSIILFARQVQNAAPTLGFRLRKEWSAAPPSAPRLK
ncbi:MAG: translocation/assembly module TamB domain-containing protein [Mariprofundaceae bacterium]